MFRIIMTRRKKEVLYICLIQLDKKDFKNDVLF